MNGWAILALVFLVALAFFLLYAAKKSEKRTVLRETGERIVLERGQSLVLEFRGTPSTGYQWIDQSGPQQSLRIVRPMWFDPGSAGGSPVGAPGTYRIEYAAVEPGAADLKFAYLRSWEPQKPAESIDVRVVVRP